MKMSINITEIDSHAVDYILDLIEQDFIRAGGVSNIMRGGRLFQEVAILKNLLKQEVYLARSMPEKIDA